MSPKLKPKNKNLYFSIGLIFLCIVSTTTFQGSTSGKTSVNNVLIPYVNFSSADCNINGLADEYGFFNFIISLDSGIAIQVWWRHNSDDLHVILQVQTNIWLAIGWLNSTPKSSTGASVIDHANILIGSNNSIQDDTGYLSALKTDSKNNFISSIAFYNGSDTNFEFLFPLQSNDPLDQSLTMKGYGFFIFAVGLNANVNDGHGGSERAMYIPNVYIESQQKEGYIKPVSAPFIDSASVFIALTLFSSFLLIRRKK